MLSAHLKYDNPDENKLVCVLAGVMCFSVKLIRLNGNMFIYLHRVYIILNITPASLCQTFLSSVRAFLHYQANIFFFLNRGA